MGIGNKPFLDIRSSQSPITDRSVAAELMGGRILSSRSRASIAVSTFDYASKRPHSTVSTSSTSSNGSAQVASHQPASMFDFRAIAEDEEFGMYLGWRGVLGVLTHRHTYKFLNIFRIWKWSRFIAVHIKWRHWTNRGRSRDQWCKTATVHYYSTFGNQIIGSKVTCIISYFLYFRCDNQTVNKVALLLSLEGCESISWTLVPEWHSFRSKSATWWRPIKITLLLDVADVLPVSVSDNFFIHCYIIHTHARTLMVYFYTIVFLNYYYVDKSCLWHHSPLLSVYFSIFRTLINMLQMSNIGLFMYEDDWIVKTSPDILHTLDQPMQWRATYLTWRNNYVYFPLNTVQYCVIFELAFNNDFQETLDYYATEKNVTINDWKNVFLNFLKSRFLMSRVPRDCNQRWRFLCFSIESKPFVLDCDEGRLSCSR